MGDGHRRRRAPGHGADHRRRPARGGGAARRGGRRRVLGRPRPRRTRARGGPGGPRGPAHRRRRPGRARRRAADVRRRRPELARHRSVLRPRRLTHAPARRGLAPGVRGRRPRGLPAYGSRRDLPRARRRGPGTARPPARVAGRPVLGACGLRGGGGVARGLRAARDPRGGRRSRPRHRLPRQPGLAVPALADGRLPGGRGRGRAPAAGRGGDRGGDVGDPRRAASRRLPRATGRARARCALPGAVSIARAMLEAWAAVG